MEIIKTVKTDKFDKWMRKLNKNVQDAVSMRILRLEGGNFGDCKSVGGGVYELRIHSGAGYRVYYGRSGNVVVVLLIGGDKSTQTKDIEQAKEMWSCLTKKP